jgi:hypothetical protein
MRPSHRNQLTFMEGPEPTCWGWLRLQGKSGGHSEQHHNQNRLRMAVSFVDAYQLPITRKGVG